MLKKRFCVLKDFDHIFREKNMIYLREKFKRPSFFSHFYCIIIFFVACATKIRVKSYMMREKGTGRAKNALFFLLFQIAEYIIFFTSVLKMPLVWYTCSVRDSFQEHY